MLLGTHNSGTFASLVWWQKPFGFILNPLSRCQNKNIAEQLMSDVRVFNFQITKHKNDWYFSHGLCIYDYTISSALQTLLTYEIPVYIQIYLDKNFFLGQDKEAFKIYVDNLVDSLKYTNVHILNAWIEGTDEYIYKSKINIDLSEKYWTSKDSWFPYPEYYAKKNNKRYIEENSHLYLMLDFV